MRSSPFSSVFKGSLREIILPKTSQYPENTFLGWHSDLATLGNNLRPGVLLTGGLDRDTRLPVHHAESGKRKGPASVPARKNNCKISTLSQPLKEAFQYSYSSLEIFPEETPSLMRFHALRAAEAF